MGAMRFFNTAGPMKPQKHYCVPPLSRLDVDDLLTLIRNESYFVLHAPRQTGKTSALLALRDLLNGGAHGEYRCVYVNVEPGQAARENQAEAMRAILSELEIITGGSAFNVKAESLRIGDFTEAEVRALLGQHTAESGQPFAQEALRAVWELTAGQPWLVNSLARQACFRNEAGRDRSRTITAEGIHDAREQLILRRETHLEQLTDKLQEERVRRVIGPVLSGGQPSAEMRPDDLQYVRDLGLAARDDPIRIANPIYREVIPRDLTWTTQAGFAHDPAWYVEADGSLNLTKLLAEFQEFSVSTPSTGSSGSSTGRPGRSCCCRRSCSASSTRAAAWNASTDWGGCAPTC